MKALLTANNAETPPRAWGRLESQAVLQPLAGNTPTGVGKTLASEDRVCYGQKHPHGRGEDWVNVREKQGT